MKNTSDFVLVRLTPEGRELAGSGETMRFVSAHSDYTFTGSTPQRVQRRGELPMLLAYHFADGVPVFEIAPAPQEPTSDVYSEVKPDVE